jgi:hypothetical protein
MTIAELEEFFSTANIPDKISLNGAVHITNVPSFIESHLNVVKRYGLEVKAFESFYNRLIALKNKLETR